MQRRNIAAWLAVLVCLVAGVPALAQVNIGDKPDLNFRTVDGRTVTSSALKGHIVVLDFWATWCHPCMEMAQHMVDLNKRYHGKGVAIIGISLDSDLASMQRVVKEKGFEWPQSCDLQGWKGATVQQFAVQGIPNTVILTPDGRVAWQGHPAAIDEPLAEAVKKYPFNLTPEQKLEEAVKHVREAGEAAGGPKKDYAGALKMIDGIQPATLRESSVLAAAGPLVTAFRPSGDLVKAKPMRDALKANHQGAVVVDTLTKAIAAAKRHAENAARAAAAATQPATTRPATTRPAHEITPIPADKKEESNDKDDDKPAS